MKTAAPRHAVATTDGLQLSALMEGRSDGPTLVLVHGYPDNLHVWDHVAAALADRYRIIRYDVRGAGQSDAPSRFSGYQLCQLLADFRRVIDQLSPHAPVHLVGHDWGSIQGWEFATAPALSGRIASFTSISGPCLDHIGQAQRTQGLNRDTLKQLAASWYIGAFHMPLLAPLVWRRGLSRHWPKVLARLERIPPPAPQATQHRDSLNGIGLYRANVLSRLLKPRTRKAIAPVQLLIAKHDPFVTAALLRGLEPHTPQLQRVELPCGHWSPLSHPQLLVEHIHHFAQQIDLSAEAV